MYRCFNICICFSVLQFHAHYITFIQTEHQYDPLHPIECLESHLKKVVFKSFQGYRRQVEFARFFVLNAKALDKIEFEVYIMSTTVKRRLISTCCYRWKTELLEMLGLNSCFVSGQPSHRRH